MRHSNLSKKKIFAIKAKHGINKYLTHSHTQMENFHNPAAASNLLSVYQHRAKLHVPFKLQKLIQPQK